ncbi:MAG: DUF2779 domain-containing protein [Anaerolineaceae bacterium]|jgi:hypothetical protein|nr:DUF2779 domain-containing protein [Anaerolineaceae bacterium]MDD4042146.1 DUF2779 domain-containing protein [Anaerolineaceae bacterium]MDD4578016.1 DUF2779 domain-containing protein [Anaerolineaceae bacterium]
MDTSNLLTKSDFLLFLEAPRHLWAKKQDLIGKAPSAFDIHNMEQGYQVEALAREYLAEHVLKANESMSIQDTFTDGRFTVKTDALIYKPDTNSYDLYEVKSGTSLKKENLYDITYQFLIIKEKVNIDRVFILHLNGEYIRDEILHIQELFEAEDVTGKVLDILDEVYKLREIALNTAFDSSLEDTAACLNPKGCPCPEICFPELPAYSVFDIPKLSAKKKTELLNQGIIDIHDVPKSFDLNIKQRQIVDVAQSNRILINREAIQKEINKFKFPLYFLDYETYLSAIPLFPGNKPQQQMVFQYSLYKLDSPNGEPCHSDHLAITKKDPSISLIKQLRDDISEMGTVFVWNKSFEMTRNKEMAIIHPEYAGFLEEMNDSTYDLGDIINLGYYIHPEFKGSWSLKNVLPVMVPELSYEEMPINKGDQAMTVWWTIVNGNLSDEESEKLKIALLDYCKLDTWAMVEIWRVFTSLNEMSSKTAMYSN